jgi:hypothetical protein
MENKEKEKWTCHFHGWVNFRQSSDGWICEACNPLPESAEPAEGKTPEEKAHQAVMNYLTDGDEDFKYSTLGADDFKIWWIKGYNTGTTEAQERIRHLEEIINKMEDYIESEYNKACDERELTNNLELLHKAIGREHALESCAEALEKWKGTQA